MPPETMTATTLSRSRCVTMFWSAICALVIFFVAIQAAETVVRITFPWDMIFWPESSLLTDMMKLDHHLPVYTTPADGNSFVYSPGLDYLTYSLLKPFGLELDVRFCRLVSVLLGIAASGLGALAIRRLARVTVSNGRSALYFLVSWGAVWLVLSKNFLADMPHPDNFHAFHAVAVFLLSLTAVETKRFRLGVITMIVAGLGVFTKQTEALAFLGPTVIFALFSPWEWRRWLLLVAIGAGTVAGALYLVWLPHYARFWTFQVLSHQPVWPTKIYTLTADLLVMDRSVLACLGLIAALSLITAGGAASRYIICWAAVGCFTVLPNVSAYLKQWGTWNNLIIFEIWLILIVWPFFGMLLDTFAAEKPESAPGIAATWGRVIPRAVCALTVIFLLLILPIKMPMRSGHYRYCETIEGMIRDDFAGGRKVLLSYGTEFLLRAGSREIPRDRCNTLLELGAAKYDEMSDMKSRIDRKYYDKIYLIMGSWYGTNMLKEIDQNYMIDSIVPAPPYKPKIVFGYGELMEDCKILVPRPPPHEEPPHGSAAY